MIVLLGETAAVREIDKTLSLRHLPTVRVDIRDELAYVRRGQGQTVEELPLEVWQQWMFSEPLWAVVEAGHPSSGQFFQPLRYWCNEHGVPYVRLERPETKVPQSPLIHTAVNWEEVIFILEQLVRNKQRGGQRITVFVTTGSHQLESLVRATFSRDVRWVVRVLPEGRVVQKCQDLGIPPKDIVAMQGPFSKELNRILFKSYGADVLLTRDSGPAGGTDTKIAAALTLGLDIILVKRLRSEADITVAAVHSVEEVLRWLHKVVKEHPVKGG